MDRDQGENVSQQLISQKQPKEISFLYIAAAVFALVLWNTKLALQYKLAFTLVLIAGVSIFGSLFYWLETLKVKNP